MAIQCRHGKYADFNPEKLVTGEWATVTNGDPNASDGKGVYHCFSPGSVKRMATYEDMAENVNNATKEIQDSFTASVKSATTAAQNAATAANEAKEAANSAAEAANEAAEKANAAAGGEISEKTVTFTAATTRTNIATGEKLSALFGKIAKWLGDLKAAAFCTVKNDLTQSKAGEAVLDAAQGKILNDKIEAQNVIESQTVNGIGQSYLFVSPKDGYALAAAYNFGRQYNDVRITDIGFNGNENVYYLFLDKTQGTNASIAIRFVWVKTS